MDKLQEKKSNAKAAYIKARNEWENIRTIEDIKGDLSLPCLQIHTAEALGCLAS